MKKGSKCSEELKNKWSLIAKKKYENGYVSPNKGRKHSEEFKEKCRIRFKKQIESGNFSPPLKGKKMSEEQKKKMIETRKYNYENGITSKIVCSEERKKKIGDSNRGRKFSEEYKKKCSERCKKKIEEGYIPTFHVGYKHSEETKKKLSNSLKGRKMSKETIEKRINTLREKIKNGELIYKVSDEQKKKISNTLKRKYKSGEIKKTVYTDEMRLKRAETMRLKDEKEKIENKFYNTKPELLAEEILKKYNLNYNKQKLIKDNINIRFYDFYLPDYNLLIEIDGCYWHSKDIKDENVSERLKDMRENDYYKDRLAKENGFDLIRIWEDEIDKLEEFCKVILFYRKAS